MHTQGAFSCLLLLVLLPAAAGAAEPPDVEEADLLRLSPAMARFLVKNVSHSQDPSAQVYDLVDLIRSKKKLNVNYEKTGTKTAIETFESRGGNCLSFTVLFVAMARHLGLNAYFQEVSEVMSWDLRGEVIVRNQHMFAEVEVFNGRIKVDFLPGTEKSYRLVRRITEERALAHYYNNLGVDLLAEGRVERAVASFEKAVAADASFAPAWTNRGVAYRRLGDVGEAERSHLRAIDEDKSFSVAIANLASLYQATGRETEALPFLRQVEEKLAKSPFHRFQLGRRSLEDGNPRDAVRHLREAVGRLPREAVLHAVLGEAYTALGERAKAVESLEKAVRLADGEEKQRFEEQLAALIRH